MSDSTTQVKNDRISVELKQGADCHVTLEVQVSPAVTQEYYTKAVKAINKEVSLPGFRKGKAPTAMILDKFGSVIEKEWKEIVTKETFYEALDLVKITPFSSKSVKKVSLKNCSKEQGASLTVEFESHPQPPSIDPSQLKMEPVEKHVVSEEEIKEEEQRVGSYFATYEEVLDRPAKNGDFVTIDLEILEEPPFLQLENERLELNERIMIDWLYNLIIGLKTGEQKEGQAFAQGQEQNPKNCRVTLKRIEAQVLPNLDDDFAKKIGLSKIEEFRPKIKERLEQQALQSQKVEMRKKLKDIISKAYVFDLPKGVVEEEIKHRKQQGSDKNQEELREEAEEALRTHFLLRKYAQDQKIQVTKEEISREYSHQMTNLPEAYRTFSKDMDGEEIFSRLHLDLLLVKSIDSLLEKMHSNG